MIDIIQKRLDAYKATNPVEEEQVIKEILQEVALKAFLHEPLKALKADTLMGRWHSRYWVGPNASVS